MIKLVSLFLILFLVACSPAKIKDFDKDYTQSLVGKLKSMEIKNYEYKYINKDTILLVKTTVLDFDTNNNVIHEKIVTEDKVNENNYIYVNNQLIEKIPLNEKNNSKTTYKYDENNNLIEEKSFDDKQTFLVKTKKFDKYHNPIEEQLTYFGKNKTLTKTEYDYKKRSFISRKSFDTIISTTVETKKLFNKKGYIIKSPTFDKNYFTFEIDKKGNLTKKTYYKNDNSIIETVTYNNVYDKKGNIIVRNRFLDGKQIDKTTYNITYY
ncbi:hypothetical protein [Flavobacterium capsici]|uniref:YD repeat-containing protein n=1 Tax=Flavobacterium capsici TaxID=3075618 RepID=A0AA96J7K0_9FLAO|nr:MULTISPECIES: hypothetical protein [unclassified Flavobacterium]WNM18404.1 hypothetical protein RN608_10310 [Flavobacterium sp. PMR2A8]WNM22455.1 hypothetical protein RN605_03610 [Flavobacterium sp. PMTSA4]